MNIYSCHNNIRQCNRSNGEWRYINHQLNKGLDMGLLLLFFKTFLRSVFKRKDNYFFFIRLPSSDHLRFCVFKINQINKDNQYGAGGNVVVSLNFSSFSVASCRTALSEKIKELMFLPMQIQC